MHLSELVNQKVLLGIVQMRSGCLRLWQMSRSEALPCLCVEPSSTGLLSLLVHLWGEADVNMLIQPRLSLFQPKLHASDIGFFLRKEINDLSGE